MNWDDLTSIFEELKKHNLFGIAKQKLEEELKALKHFNILIAGQTGVGKSTLINGVFGENIAKAGQGEPVTKTIKWYTFPNSPLRLIDTRGLELVEYQETLAQLKSEMVRCDKANNVEDKIHIAWICISEGSTRIQDGEKELVKLCSSFGIPVIVVITKSQSIDDRFLNDVSSSLPEAKRIIRVMAQETPTVIGIIPVSGLMELVEETRKLIPDGIKNAFVAAQQVNMKLKKDRGWQIASLSAGLAGGGALIPVPGSGIGSFATINITMLISISVAFGLEMTVGTAAAIATAAISALGLAYGIRMGLGELLKFVPGLGSASGAALEVTTAISTTYAIGIGFTEYLISFQEINNRMPNIDELKAGFQTYWKNNPNKEIQPPTSS